MNDQQYGNELEAWRSRTFEFERALNDCVLGLRPAVRLLLIAILARGHVLLEGNVGVGKTTLLRAAARGLGGAYERIEGTVDLMPQDLVYHTFIDRDGKPRVDPGPLLTHGASLSVFFFNEINRARPQVHSLLLRAMAERSLTAFGSEYRFPYLQVFADRNRVEQAETCELPGAARDRFLMEIEIAPDMSAAVHRSLMFDPRFHDSDALIAGVAENLIDFRKLPAIAAGIQAEVRTTPAIEEFVEHLRAATHRPAEYGIALDNVDMDELVLAGASPRGMSMLVRAAKVAAWLDGAADLSPAHLRAVFHEVIAHRVFFTPIYELQRTRLARAFSEAVLARVPAP
jgi:MoxR-like ATPase